MKPAVVVAAVALGIALAASSSQASTPSSVVFAANRAPAVAGEIWRLDPSGKRVDLSKSPYVDSSPVVSPDGKRVAFISNRSGKRPGVYEVGTDGRGLVTVARRVPSLDTNNSSLVWQPHGSLLATGSNDGVSILQRGRLPINFSHARFGVSRPWSPDGRVLLLLQGLNELRAVSPAGRTLWTRGADSWNGAWSSKGLVAIAAYRGVAVYDEAGRVRFQFKLPTSPAVISWSPDGSRLAVLWGVSHYTLDVRSATGARLLEKRVQGGNLGWDGDAKVVMGTAGCLSCSKPIGIDVRTGNTSPASDRWLEPRSPDGTLAIVTPKSGSGFALGVTRLASGATRTYGKVSGCYLDETWSPAVASQQFAGRSIVYQSWTACDGPFANLYSVGSSGGRPQRLTTAQHQQTQPALSPDGSEIAYVWADATGMSCKGCSDGIRIASATGKPIRTLTNPDNCTFDDSPTWSPDGTTLLYAESDCSDPGELYTIAAAGGTPHDLGIRGQEPAWGPSRIAYVGSDQSDSGLWTAKPDGTDRVRIAKTGRLPAYSSSGALAYIARRSVVWDGNAHKLPFADVQSLAWSPDGTRFVLVAKLTGSASYDLFTVRTDGTHPARLTKNYGVFGAR